MPVGCCKGFALMYLLSLAVEWNVANVPMDNSVAEDLEDKDEAAISGEYQSLSELDMQLAVRYCVCSVF